MINAKEVLEDPENLKKNINNLFNNKNDSKISLVRVAINFNHAYQTKPIIDELKKLGYEVGLNLMQAHDKSKEEYEEVGRIFNSWNIDVLYFADSLGNMGPEQVAFICKNLRKEWKGEIGIHTHNNKGHALINSITAIENGVTWIDGTIVGMGRGAGNAPTESLILEISRLGYFQGNPLLIQPTVTDFTLLKDKYSWGPNFYYHFAANHNIHPTYVQSLLEDQRYTKNRILKALEMLSAIDSSSFSREKVRDAVYSNQNTDGSWNASNWLRNEDVMIVGAGPSVKKYKKKIEKFIKLKKIKVLFLNMNESIDQSLGFATIACNETRVLLEANEYKKLNHPLIMPLTNLSKILKERLKDLDILDYGLSLKKNQIKVSDKGCILDSPLAIGYALSIATIGNTNKIFLVGFDGYKNNDSKNEEMNKLFNKYYEIDNSLDLICLTPTSYQTVSQDSFGSYI
jgi:4-hydroxy 2-oxovalerate aldolase